MNDNDNMDVGDSEPQPTCLAPRKTLPGTTCILLIIGIVMNVFVTVLMETFYCVA